MKNKIKVLALLVALVLVVGAATYITQQEEPVEPTMSEVETPVEAPVETPIEGDAAVEGQPAADETSATGNLGGSVGENNFGMTNLMDSIKDNNQTDVEHSLDLEEQKQEQPQPLSGNEGSGTGSSDGTGTQTGVPSGNEGSGTGSSVGGNSGTGTQPEVPSNPQPQTPSDERFDSKEDWESLGSVDKVTGYNEEFGGFDIVTDTGEEQLALPDGTTIDKELLEILKQYQ